MAKDALPRDGMSREKMATAHDSMGKACPDAMGKGAMKQDAVVKDAMKK
jgi:pentapeptide MXKDX repeat protein